jgi:hypothetical protein
MLTETCRTEYSILYTIKSFCCDGRITAIQLEFQISIYVNHVWSCSSAATRVELFICCHTCHVEMLAVSVQYCQPTHIIRLITNRLHQTVLFAKPTYRFTFTTCIYTCQYLADIGCRNFVLVHLLILGARLIC